MNQKHSQQQSVATCHSDPHEVKEEDLDSTIKKINHNKLSFGVNYLDDAAGGILSNDMIVLAASSGAGKSSIASEIAYHNAVAGKSVCYIALEAFKYEIELRIAYRMAAELFCKTKLMAPECTLQEFLEGKVPKDFQPYINDSKSDMRVLSHKLVVKYRDKNDYDIEKFENDMKYLGLMSDLIIIDHLHFFDYDEKAEYSQITRIVKKIRDLALLMDTPIILLSQLRKMENSARKYIPNQFDLHGSSNIFKVASKVILMCPNFKADRDSHTEFPTLFRVAKNRYNGGVTRYVGSHIYDICTGVYSNSYNVAKLNFEETDFTYCVNNNPKWVKSANS